MSDQTLEEKYLELEKRVAELKAQVSVRHISIDFHCKESIDLEVPLMMSYKSERRTNMDYKAVLQGQIRELQKLQDKNIRSDGPLELKVDNAIKLADQIKKIVEVRE